MWSDFYLNSSKDNNILSRISYSFMIIKLRKSRCVRFFFKHRVQNTRLESSRLGLFSNMVEHELRRPMVAVEC